MEYTFKAQARGLTQLKSVQVIENQNAPFEITSIDAFATVGVPGRFTGVSLGSETRFLQAVHPLIPKNTGLRYYSLFIEGGDVQPPANTEEDLRKKKVLALDINTRRSVREIVSDCLHIPSAREPFVRSLGNHPALLNALWAHDLFAHLNAIQWFAEIPLLNGIRLSRIRLITLRDISLIRQLHCFSSPEIGLNDVRIVPCEGEITDAGAC